MGAITSVATGVAKVSGLPGVGFDELATFPGDVFAIAIDTILNHRGISHSLMSGALLQKMQHVDDFRIPLSRGK